MGVGTWAAGFGWCLLVFSEGHSGHGGVRGGARQCDGNCCRVDTNSRPVDVCAGCRCCGHAAAKQGGAAAIKWCSEQNRGVQ